ncbi:YceD family protein [Propionivibrio sp.]|jgi:uncharacterized protein|uniref:YceD family protein n=1 Tax=Propionivibrio sp. TaxID=2212460 RepID=UPI0039E3382E
MSQRVVIDSLAFAREGGSLQGELPVASLARVLDMLTDPAGDLSYRVQGRMGPRNRPQLVLEVDGVLSVRCQRCLEGIDSPVRIRSLLELVKDEEELTQEEIEDDSKDFLTAQKELDVVALIEDEIILDLPAAPRHESCALPQAGGLSEKVSPFSVLKGKVR